MIQRFALMVAFVMAFLVFSGYAYAQYNYPYDPGNGYYSSYPYEEYGNVPEDQYGNPPVCSYDQEGYPVYCNNDDGYNYYGHGPYWGGEEEEHQWRDRDWGEHRGEERERGEHQEGGQHHYGGEHHEGGEHRE